MAEPGRLAARAGVYPGAICCGPRSGFGLRRNDSEREPRTAVIQGARGAIRDLGVRDPSLCGSSLKHMVATLMALPHGHPLKLPAVARAVFEAGPPLEIVIYW